MKAGIYTRKSKYTGKGESIETQIQLCREYCEKNGISIYDIYEDEGYTGANIDRPDFKRMLKDSKAKKFDVLICYRLDRVSRSIIDFSSLVNDLQELEIEFVSIKEQFDTTTPLGRAMMYIASVFAQLERETLAERIKDNMRELARTGRWLGGKCPTGFESVPVTYYDDKMKKKKLYKLNPINSELKVIKELFNKFIKLGGIYKLQGYCYKNGLKSKNNKDFDIRALKFILSNPVYAVADELTYEYCKLKEMDIAAKEEDFDGTRGIMSYNKRDVRKGKGPKDKDPSEWIISVGRHKGVIPAKDWIMAQNILNTKAPSYRSGTSKVGILSPLLVCSNCKSKMRIVYKYTDGEIKSYYYKCRLKENSRCTQCNIKNINGKKADESIVGKLKTIALNRQAIIEEYKNKENEANKNFNITNRDKKDLTKEQSNLKKQIYNLTLQLSENIKSAAAQYIIVQIEDLDKRIKEINKELDRIETNNEHNKIRQMNIDVLEQNLKIFLNNFDDMTVEEKKIILKSIVEQINWDGENLSIKLLEI